MKNYDVVATFKNPNSKISPAPDVSITLPFRPMIGDRYYLGSFKEKCDSDQTVYSEQELIDHDEKIYLVEKIVIDNFKNEDAQFVLTGFYSDF